MTALDRSSVIDRIISYEQGETDQDQTLELFQFLIDSNMIGSLQGHYGRTAERLLNAGLIHPRQAHSVKETRHE